MQTYEQLQKALNIDDELPVTPEWSASADFLFLMSEYCLLKKPQTIVECSSGLTTLILAKCCQMNEIGHVYSLENAEEYQKQTQENLVNFNLESYVDVIHAPLARISIDYKNLDWYQIKALKDLQIDFLVIDGPPGFIQRHSRLPALPMLYDQMSNISCVFLDDAARNDEKEIVQIWLDRYSDIEHDYIETERGCSVININKS